MPVDYSVNHSEAERHWGTRSRKEYGETYDYNYEQALIISERMAEAYDFSVDYPEGYLIGYQDDYGNTYPDLDVLSSWDISRLNGALVEGLIATRSNASLANVIEALALHAGDTQIDVSNVILALGYNCAEVSNAAQRLLKVLIGQCESSVTSELIQLLTSTDKRKRELAVYALHALGNSIIRSVIPHLVVLLEEMASKEEPDALLEIELTRVLSSNLDSLTGEMIISTLVKLHQNRVYDNSWVEMMIKHFAGDKYLKKLKSEKYKFSRLPLVAKSVFVGFFLGVGILSIFTCYFFISEGNLVMMILALIFFACPVLLLEIFLLLYIMGITSF